jgi:hypothetical protein
VKDQIFDPGAGSRDEKRLTVMKTANMSIQNSSYSLTIELKFCLSSDYET